MAFQNMFSFLSGLLCRRWEANRAATCCFSSRPVCPHTPPASIKVRKERPKKMCKNSCFRSRKSHIPEPMG